MESACGQGIVSGIKDILIKANIEE